MADQNWKLKLKYGKLVTPYKHFTALADGIHRDVERDSPRAWMSLKIWCLDSDEAVDVMRSIAPQLDFEIDGQIEIYDSEPVDPPEDSPHGYEANFTYYDR